MKIRYNNTRADLIKGQLWMLAHNNFAVTFFGILWMAIASLSFNSSAVAEATIFTKFLFALIQATIALSIGGCFSVFYVLLSVFTRKSTGLVGEHELTILDDGIEEVTEVNKTLNKWEGMKGLKESKSLCLLYVTQATAHVIPRNRELIEGDLDEFLSEVKMKLNNV
ncbi:YcxB family protein [Pelagicoccus sp. SDUM812003]|uniref:YcxB family protein n=1 Tax=Pelagicoccus sp. SDUM812003 TaxID=3041267 RepID=UPI00280DCB7C|nr:YcxB family protein [Pelagicoccus sp. SDUM812003]MDQ8205724.1 YcxB family protein [Pelagicoccus sp. SDUM812003]